LAFGVQKKATQGALHRLTNRFNWQVKSNWAGEALSCLKITGFTGRGATRVGTGQFPKTVKHILKEASAKKRQLIKGRSTLYTNFPG
jgi:hypothetical protein